MARRTASTPLGHPRTVRAQRGNNVHLFPEQFARTTKRSTTTPHTSRQPRTDAAQCMSLRLSLRRIHDKVHLRVPEEVPEGDDRAPVTR